jgi:pyruvate,water dikinase
MATLDSVVLWFEDVGLDDVGRVGGKNASLGEMIRSFKAEGIHVPDGYATTAHAYRNFLSDNALDGPIRADLECLARGTATLEEMGARIRARILEGRVTEPIAQPILEAYRELCRRAGRSDVEVAVRSSATAEDLPEASFAGQQESFLNVRGDRALLNACRRCFASLFTDRAISYRAERGIDHMRVSLSAGIQRMVRADLAGSGVMFSIDIESGFPDVVVIDASWGLGESVVQGLVVPDKYLVFKPPLADPSLCPIVERTLGSKERKIIFDEGSSGRTKQVQTSRAERHAFVLKDEEVLQLSRWAVSIERHYGRPMDMEWAKDGVTGELAILQARPETVQARARDVQITVYRLKDKRPPLLTGAAIGQAIVTAPVCLIRTAAEIGRFQPGSILATETTDPDWGPIMGRAAGIVTNFGGTTSHAAIVSRELGVPAIVGTLNATDVLRDEQVGALSCAEGEQGRIYDGQIDFEVSTVDASALPPTRTAIMVNLANPATAFQWWRLPAKGVGLARMEFIISSAIKIHPMALVHPERVADTQVRRTIYEMTRGFSHPRDYFVDRLACGIGKIAVPFHPNPVIVRLSDFKTNEYANLIGGADFETHEENPMLGFRGASRYYSDRYREGFALECKALRRVRLEMGLRNIVVMVPFCRTLAEADRVLEVMAVNGLERGTDALQVFMMCEIPSNVILAEDFARRFDGFSIGSNDLTQLILGVDRDSAELASLFDESNEAVKRAIRETIRRAHAVGIKVGLCGQAPSNSPAFAAFLVEEGIDSISLTPDSFAATVRHVAEVEHRLEVGSKRPRTL